MEQNQNVLVVYESADLHFWWTSLSSHWKGLLAGRFSISGVPSREQLHQITRIKQLDLSKYPLIQTLDPLLKLPLLNELDCHNTGISDLSPIESLLDLKKLNILGTRVVNLTPLSRLTKLETLNFDNTDVNNISPLINLSDLRTIYCDKTLVLPEDIISFMGGHMDCMVVYQTESLELWWNSLLGIWKTIMDKMMGYNLNASIMPNREQLQSMVNLRRINLMQYPEFSDSLIQLKNLDYIVKYVFLEELRFTKTGITRLDTLRNLKYLKVLSCPNNPIETLEPVSEFSNLTELDIQNTPVRSLGFLGILYNLKKLNCSGTLIKDLKGLEHLVNLEQLECYNTKIRNLKWIENLKNLKIIRCSNTKISSKKIQKFKDAHPGVEVVYF